MEPQPRLVFITSRYGLILRLCHHTGKFPANTRLVLGKRIERNLNKLLEIVIRAKHTRQRQELLEQVNLMLEFLHL